MLAIDALVAKATTTTTNLQAMIPQIWARNLEKNLRLHDVFGGSIVVNADLQVPGAGDTLYIPLLPDLVAADPLTEGNDMVPVALSNATSVPLVPSEWGKVVEITRKSLDRIGYDGVSEIVDRLGYAMSVRIQVQTALQWNVAVPGSGNGQNFVVQYPNGHTSATIVAGDTFSDAVILNAVATLETANNVPFEDGYYRLFITPNQWKALIQDSNIRNDLRYASPEKLLNGEKGALHGCRIVTSNYQPATGNTVGGLFTAGTGLNIAAENTQNVAKAFLMAPRAIAMAYKRKPEVYIDPTLYDGGRKRRMGVTADFDIKPLHWERMVVITTVNS